MPMIKRRKTRNILLLGVLVLALIFLFQSIFRHTKKRFLSNYVYLEAEKSTVRVSPGCFTFYFNKGILLDSCDFMLDSGCSSSYLHSDSAHSSVNFKIGATITVTDFHNQQKVYPLYYTTRLCGNGRFSIRNIVYAKMPNHLGVEKAILGMDVFQNANWYINFKDKKLTVMGLYESLSVKKNSICFSYLSTRDPMVSIQIGNSRIDSVLLDLGMADNDLCLKPAALSVLLESSSHFVMDSIDNYGMNGTIKTLRCNFDTIMVNHQVFDSVTVIQGSKNAIGLDFMRRFDHLFWDSRHKKVYLWN